MKKLFVCFMLIVAACRDQRPPVPTSQQADQLNDAENMLNTAAANEEGPETNATGPSRLRN